MTNKKVMIVLDDAALQYIQEQRVKAESLGYDYNLSKHIRQLLKQEQELFQNGL